MAVNQRFDSLRSRSLPVAAGTVSGSPVVVGSFVGVTLTDVGEGGNAAGHASVALDGAFDLGVGTSTAVAVGDPIYITSGYALTPSASGNVLFGHALEAKGTAVGEVIAIEVGAGADSTGSTFDPAADETITGAWDFTSTATATADYVDITGLDFDSGDPIANTGIRFSVEPPAANDNLFAVQINKQDASFAGRATLTIIEGDPEENSNATRVTFYVVLPTTGASGDQSDYIPVTANDIIAAFNASSAAGRVAATTAPGSTGAGTLTASVVSGGSSGQPLRSGVITPHVELTDGIITSPVTIIPDEKHQTPLSLRPALDSIIGTAVINIEYYDGTPNNASGYGVAHIDSDGGGGLAGNRIIWSELGRVNIDADPGDAAFVVASGGATAFRAGGGYAGLVANSTSDTDRCLALFTYPSQSVDAIELYNGDLDAFAFRVTPAGEVHADGGVVLKSPDGTAYRLIVANDGTLSTEPA